MNIQTEFICVCVVLSLITLNTLLRGYHLISLNTTNKSLSVSVCLTCWMAGPCLSVSVCVCLCLSDCLDACVTIWWSVWTVACLFHSQLPRQIKPSTHPGVEAIIWVFHFVQPWNQMVGGQGLGYMWMWAVWNVIPYSSKAPQDIENPGEEEEGE